MKERIFWLTLSVILFGNCCLQCYNQGYKSADWNKEQEIRRLNSEYTEKIIKVMKQRNDALEQLESLKKKNDNPRN